MQKWILLFAELDAEKIKTGRGEHKLAKKQGLTRKGRILVFQSPSLKSKKAERSKAGF
jgi:hypothetical protein